MSVHLKKRERVIKGGRNRKPRAKTFKTEQAAHNYAKEQGMTGYSLENMRSATAAQKKFRIVQA